nr:MAG TPA: hypothetical protein [Caudoviricetes sp.]
MFFGFCVNFHLIRAYLEEVTRKNGFSTTLTT